MAAGRRSWPHSSQKRRSAGLSASQLGQRTWVSGGVAPLAAVAVDATAAGRVVSTVVMASPSPARTGAMGVVAPRRNANTATPISPSSTTAPTNHGISDPVLLVLAGPDPIVWLAGTPPGTPLD